MTQIIITDLFFINKFALLNILFFNTISKYKLWKKIMKQIRLSKHDLLAIIMVFKKHFLENDRLWIFGSRVDLSKKGGDIDLYAETEDSNLVSILKRKDAFLNELLDEIGDQKIDLVLNVLSLSNVLTIYEIARKQGVRIV